MKIKLIKQDSTGQKKISNKQSNNKKKKKKIKKKTTWKIKKENDMKLFAATPLPFHFEYQSYDHREDISWITFSLLELVIKYSYYLTLWSRVWGVYKLWEVLSKFCSIIVCILNKNEISGTEFLLNYNMHREGNQVSQT